MQRKRQILYQLCGIFLGISCMLSACHAKEESFTKVAAVQEEEDARENVKKENAGKDAEEPNEEPVIPEEKKTGSIWVYICGEVINPGVYELKEGDRITHAIEAAGGLTSEAGEVYLNQAAHLTDGQKIYVPSREEEQSLGQDLPPSEAESPAQSVQDTGKVNINTATKEELLSLNGIGESRAEAILSYRKDSGGFRTIEDLKKVDGIKDGIFQKIREQITVE